MRDSVARVLGGTVGENRPTARTVHVRFPVEVIVEWPEGVEYSDDEAIDVAQCVVSQSCERDVGHPGKIIWARCFAEVDDTEAEVLMNLLQPPKSP